MSRITIRELVLLLVIVGMAIALWASRGGRRHQTVQPPEVQRGAENDAPAPHQPPDNSLPAIAAPSLPNGIERQFLGHTGPVQRLAVSDDGHWLLSGSTASSGDGTVRLWDVATGMLVHTFPPVAGEIHGLGFTPDGRRAVVLNLGTIQVLDLASGKEVGRQFIREGPVSLAIGPEGSLAAIGLTRGDVVVWDYKADAERQHIRGPQRASTTLAFSPDGHRLFAASREMLRLWDAASGEQFVGGESHDSRELRSQLESQEANANQADKALQAAKAAREEFLQGTFVAAEKSALSNLFVAEQNLRAAERSVASAKRLFDKGIVTKLQEDGAEATAENARQQFDVYQKQLDTLRKYTKQRLLTEYDDAIVTAEVAARDERAALELARDRWNQRSFASFARPIACLAVSPDGARIAVGQKLDEGEDSPAIVVLDAATGEQQLELRGPSGGCTCLAFTPDGRTLLSGGREEFVYHWDLRSGQIGRRHRAPGGVMCLAISADGKRFFTANTPPTSASREDALVNYAIQAWPLDDRGE
jgi:WD40 repeat protein